MALPELNRYGKLVVASGLGGVGTVIVGLPLSSTAAFVGFAAVVLAVAMRRSDSSEEERSRDGDDDSGTDDTEMKAKAEAGGATGSGF